MDKNVKLTARVNELEEELAVWKQARAATRDSAERSKRTFEDEKAELLRRISRMESQQVSPFSFFVNTSNTDYTTTTTVSATGYFDILRHRWRWHHFRRLLNRCWKRRWAASSATIDERIIGLCTQT